MYEQATIAVQNEPAFHTLRGAIDTAFSATGADGFLRSLDKGKLRVRHFEEVLAAGKLGPDAARCYAELGDADQGMVREHYLSSLERVEPELRSRYLKVYAYY